MLVVLQYPELSDGVLIYIIVYTDVLDFCKMQIKDPVGIMLFFYPCVFIFDNEAEIFSLIPVKLIGVVETVRKH